MSLYTGDIIVMLPAGQLARFLVESICSSHGLACVQITPYKVDENMEHEQKSLLKADYRE